MRKNSSLNPSWTGKAEHFGVEEQSASKQAIYLTLNPPSEGSLPSSKKPRTVAKGLKVGARARKSLAEKPGEACPPYVLQGQDEHVHQWRGAWDPSDPIDLFANLAPSPNGGSSLAI